LTNLINLRY